MFLISAVAAIGWAYAGGPHQPQAGADRGTLIWVAGTVWSGLSGSYTSFLLSQVVAAFGLGAVAVVSFAVVSDLISPRAPRPGDEFLGAVPGRRHAGRHPGRRPARHSDWRIRSSSPRPPAWSPRSPTSFTYNVPRGDSQPELAGIDVRRADPPRRPAGDPAPGGRTVWLILQGLHRADRARLAGLAAGAVPVAGRAPGLHRRHGDHRGQRVRHSVPARRRAVASSAGWPVTGCNGVPRAAGPWSPRSACWPPCRSTWCCSSSR